MQDTQNLYSKEYKTGTDVPGGYHRLDPFPLDLTDVFMTKEDATAYAVGRSDSRGLSGTRYDGQLITAKVPFTDSDDGWRPFVVKSGEKLIPILVESDQLKLHDDDIAGVSFDSQTGTLKVRTYSGSERVCGVKLAVVTGATLNNHKTLGINVAGRATQFEVDLSMLDGLVTAVEGTGSTDTEIKIKVNYQGTTKIYSIPKPNVVKNVSVVTSDSGDTEHIGQVKIEYTLGDPSYIILPQDQNSGGTVTKIELSEDNTKLLITQSNKTEPEEIDLSTLGSRVSVTGADTEVQSITVDGKTYRSFVDKAARHDVNELDVKLTNQQNATDQLETALTTKASIRELAESCDRIFDTITSECVDIGSWIDPTRVDVRFDANVTPIQIEYGNNPMLQQCTPSTEWQTFEYTWTPQSSCDTTLGIRALRPSTCVDIESITIQNNTGSIFTDDNSYVANLDFEDGSTGGWYQLQYQYGLLNSKGVHTTDQSYSGSGCMNLQLADWHAGPYYSIAVTPNHTYRLTMKYKSTDTAGASTAIIVSEGNWYHTSNKGAELGSAILSASTTEWTDVTVEFESGENSFVTVYFESSAVAGSNLYIDDFSVQCILDEDNLLSDQLSSVWLQDYYMTQNGTLLKSEGYWSWSDVDPYYYLIHTKALHFEKDVPYTLTIKWRDLSLKASSDYITLMDNDKIGLFTEECEPTEAVRSGGPWVGDQVTNSMASITVEELYGGPNIGPTAVKVHVTSVDNNHNGCSGKVGVQYGKSFLQIREVSESQWLVFNMPHECPIERYLTVSVMNPGTVNRSNLLAIDKICVLSNSALSRKKGYKIFPDKKVEFENSVIAPRIEGNIDDGCLILL